MSRQQREQLDQILRHGEFDIGGDVDEQRVIFHEMISAVPLAGDIVTTPGELGGVPVITVETPDHDPSVVVLYFHGGGYVLGSARDSVGLAADVARRVGVACDHRRLPARSRDRYPAAVTDAVAAYRALLDSGVPNSKVAFVGESAGGGLVVATLVALKEAARLPRVCCASRRRCCGARLRRRLHQGAVGRWIVDDLAPWSATLRRERASFEGRRTPARTAARRTRQPRPCPGRRAVSRRWRPASARCHPCLSLPDHQARQGARSADARRSAADRCRHQGGDGRGAPHPRLAGQPGSRRRHDPRRDQQGRRCPVRRPPGSTTPAGRKLDPSCPPLGRHLHRRPSALTAVHPHQGQARRRARLPWCLRGAERSGRGVAREDGLAYV